MCAARASSAASISTAPALAKCSAAAVCCVLAIDVFPTSRAACAAARLSPPARRAASMSAAERSRSSSSLTAPRSISLFSPLSRSPLAAWQCSAASSRFPDASASLPRRTAASHSSHAVAHASTAATAAAAQSSRPESATSSPSFVRVLRARSRCPRASATSALSPPACPRACTYAQEPGPRHRRSWVPSTPWWR